MNRHRAYWSKMGHDERASGEASSEYQAKLKLKQELQKLIDKYDLFTVTTILRKIHEEKEVVK